jgi:hypothetical protein
MSIAFVAIDMQYFEEQMALCNQLIETGIGNLVHNMSYNPLSDYTTFVPAELASFITFQLIQYVKPPSLFGTLSENRILETRHGIHEPEVRLCSSAGIFRLSRNPFTSILIL